ncbi:hypothetical protein BAJUN_01240 [Bajunvirus bajun]|uniref:Uncharacterized protein n=1 Tax=Brevundimonas phage vB_BgoS-Bajun TaxID=2948594 RepID=A0A9E7N4R9_9CAUD|nr:hypothetical protein BAJUN_01240 [Brevundimonas phage vB_BgoS-Bajun]
MADETEPTVVTDEFPSTPLPETPLQEAARKAGWEASATAEPRATGLRPPMTAEERHEAALAALQILVDMHAAIPPRAPDECVVEVSITVGDVRAAFNAVHGIRAHGS